ncbi:MAG: hypothetical protein HQK76_17615 [Desulfobacterales bacterium]|nr:hypothetical protein [Desulfobacterales bacterium]
MSAVFTFIIPFINKVSLFGEWAVSKLTYNFECTSAGGEKTNNGNAATAGINILLPKGFNTQIAYLYRNENFESLYGALTYMPNRIGGRFSTGWTRSDERFSMDFFAKYLKEAESDASSDPAEYTSISAGISFIPINNLTIRLSGLAEIQEKESEKQNLKKDSITKSATLQSSYQIIRNNYLDFKYQFINNSDDINPKNEYDAHVFNTEINIKF